MVSNPISTLGLTLVTLLAASTLALGGCIAGPSYDTPPLPVLNAPPSRDYRQLGTTSVAMDMKPRSATWRQMTDYMLATQAHREYGSDTHALVMLQYNEGPRHATGVAMAISYTPGPGMISSAQPASPAAPASPPAAVPATGAPPAKDKTFN